MFTILNFLHPKAFKIQTLRRESGFSQSYTHTYCHNSTLTGHQQQQQPLYLYPTVQQNTGEEYRLPQITIGAKQKWQPYLGDLSIIISVRYHTHTQTQNTKARMRT